MVYSKKLRHPQIRTRVEGGLLANSRLEVSMKSLVKGHHNPLVLSIQHTKVSRA